MSKNRIPDPGKFRNWMDWAKEVEKSQNSGSNLSPVEPSVVLLEHVTDWSRISAAVSGILMFDPASKTVVVSVDGQFFRVVLQPL